MTEKKCVFIVEPEQAKQRIDKFVHSRLHPELSRTAVKALIVEKRVLLNGTLVSAHHPVHTGDQITVSLKAEQQGEHIVAVAMPLDIIFEDDYLLVINKPAGMVVHPGAGHRADTLVNGLAAYTSKLSDVNGPHKLGIVHRLDKDTSGVLLVAKDNFSHRFIAQQFKMHTIEKTYLALVWGSVEHDEGIIEAPLSRSTFDRKKMRVNHASARAASTQYRVLHRSDRFSLLEAYPKTGRTHQIRVHLAHLGHPLLGDRCYGGGHRDSTIQRQALHALKLRFRHPHSKQTIACEAPVPEDMARLINALS